MVRDGVCSICGPRRRVEDQRRTAAQRGYDGRWQRWRAMVLRERPLCEDCLAQGLTVVATDVHHIVPKRNGGSDEAHNLRTLCHSCHSKITAAGG